MNIAVLIDGFNLYHHMDNKKFARYKWLNFSRFFRHYVNKDDKLEIHYFTTVNYQDLTAYRNNPEKYKSKKSRHLTLIRAEEMYGVIIHYGHFKDDQFKCEKCGHIWKRRKEKLTDVALGSYLTYLSFSRGLERFIILTADTDLIPAINLVKENSENAKIDLLLPPGETNSKISDHCDKTYTIDENVLRDSLFPLIIRNEKTGDVIRCPDEWKY